jgi:ankyrin repeat domain-containing protein 50
MDSACILWFSAGPGCGKSVLSRALIDGGRLTTKESTSTVCYFFLKEIPQRVTSTSALSAMLHQLLTLHPDKNLINCALDSHNDFGKNLCNNFLRLWNILLKCAERDKAGEIVCLIDALDECQKMAVKSS